MTDKKGITTLKFKSGVVVTGQIEKFTENNSARGNTATVVTFKNGTCKVTLGDRILFDPSWGTYDMTLITVMTATNEDINSPFNRPAHN